MYGSLDGSEIEQKGCSLETSHSPRVRRCDQRGPTTRNRRENQEKEHDNTDDDDDEEEEEEEEEEVGRGGEEGKRRLRGKGTSGIIVISR